ncbi:MAG: hypothetical protein O7B77_01820, partial [Actinobacteria bacterium]|nr:hypothetical protein [Actinomycetota bacterium]
TLGAEVFIDNVEIKGTFASEPTTTTTTGATTTTTTPTTTEATTTTTTRQTTITTEPTATTTTTEIGVVAPTDIPPSGSGIRETASGVQAGYSSGLFGSMEMGQPQVLTVELSADYKMAVEVIESSWVWMVGLLVVIAGAIVTGIDRRKTLETPPEG